MSGSYCQHKRLILYITIVLLSVLSSCGRSPSDVKQPIEPWIAKWLDNPTCQPPCWENLIPGLTSITDTISTLGAISDVTDFRGPVTGLGDELDIAWKFKASQSSGLAVSNNGEIVTQVILSLDIKQQLFVDNVVSTYGYPSHVRVLETSERLSYYDVELIYLEMGMLLGLYLSSMNDQMVEVLPTAKVHLIRLFPPGLTSFASIVNVSDSLIIKSLSDWEGYTLYPYLTP